MVNSIKFSKAQPAPKQNTKAPTPKTRKKPITTVDKKFYAGMTRAEAEKKGIYKKFIGTDFKDLDKNGDGKLSNKEIIARREKETQTLKRDAKMMGAVGALSLGAAIATSETWIGPVILGTCAIELGKTGAEKIKKAKDEAKETAQYRKELNIKG